MRWTTPDQWHVTLRYLGDVDEEAALAVFGGIDHSQVEAVVGSCAIRLAPEVLVVPVDGLDALAAAVRDASAGIGEPPSHSFVGHLTLGRQRRGHTSPLDGVATEGSFVVDEIALVRSELHTDGARYTTVATRRLSS